jgi:hypothetical protein
VLPLPGLVVETSIFGGVESPRNTANRLGAKLPAMIRKTPITMNMLILSFTCFFSYANFYFFLFVEVFLSIFYEIRAKKRRRLCSACLFSEKLFPDEEQYEAWNRVADEPSNSGVASVGHVRHDYAADEACNDEGD